MAGGGEGWVGGGGGGGGVGINNNKTASTTTTTTITTTTTPTTTTTTTSTFRHNQRAVERALIHRLNNQPAALASRTVYTRVKQCTRVIQCAMYTHRAH